jgi:integration host factor subunit beta
MNRTDLIARISARHPEMKSGKVESAINAALDGMRNAIIEGGRIEIRGFGSFCVVRRKERVARNPRTGELILLPERDVPHFKAGKELKGRVSGTRLGTRREK